MFDLDPEREPVAPRDAATVVIVRSGEGRVEVFCVRRHSKSGFMGGAIVFPGGKVDPADHHERWHQQTTDLRPRVRALGVDAITARAFAIAALRESLEEAAIVPVVGDSVDATATTALRDELERHDDTESSALLTILERRALTLDTGRLEALSRWITPRAERRRYDTRFYLLPLPDKQAGAHDRRETTASFWATAEDVLARWERGEIMLAPPTSSTLEMFVEARTVEEAAEIARQHPLDPICPHAYSDDGELVLALPGDPGHPDTQPGAIPGDPRTRFVMRDGRFVRATPRG